MGRLIVVTGGAKSGKSRFAVDLARKTGEQVTYIATCRAEDEEMRQKIAAHRRARPSHWQTIEEPAHLATALQSVNHTTHAVIIDCLTLWASQLLLDHHTDAAIQAETRRFCEAIRQVPYPVIVVTNEVGWGLVPENPLGRQFRETMGAVNQYVAAAADEVYLTVSGIPMRVK